MIDAKRQVLKNRPKLFYTYTYNQNGQIYCSICDRIFKGSKEFDEEEYIIYVHIDTHFTSKTIIFTVNSSKRNTRVQTMAREECVDSSGAVCCDPNTTH